MKKLCAALVLCLLAAGVLLKGPVENNLRENGRYAIRDAVRRAAMECYAVEGVFPPEVSYLEENYGLVINHDAYIVSYEIFASNVMPDVRVLVRGEG